MDSAARVALSTPTASSPAMTRRILAACGRPDLQPIIENHAPGEIQRQFLSSELARGKLGWAPGASLDERLRETADWYSQRRKAAA